jgi:PAS domain S-box-containing protein
MQPPSPTKLDGTAVEVRELRRFVRDLVALTSLPASWLARDPQRLAESLAGILVGTLELDLVYIGLRGGPEGPAAEVVQGPRAATVPVDDVRKLLARDVEADDGDSALASPLGLGELRILDANLGQAGEYGRVVIGTTRKGFPTIFERVFLQIGSNQLAAVLKERRLVAEGERHFQILANSAPVLVWTAGPDRVGEWFNKPWLAFRGRSLEQELGDAWTAGIHPDDVRRHEAVYANAFERRQPFEIEYRLRRHDGQYRWVVEHAVPRDGADGSFAGYIGSCFDITERKYAEEQLRAADRQKDEFLATLSHELRTPLNAIVGWAHILRDTAPGSDTAKRAVDTIVRSARAQDRLISDILDVSRIIAGKLELSVSRVELPALIEAARDTVRPAAETKDVAVTFALDTTVGEFWGDPQRLQQVVLNLLTNAIKFAPRGGQVRVTLKAGDPELTITVEDDGPGINPDFLPHVFERFRQEDSSSSRRHGGLGLGLAIARHLTELHHGTISAANRQGGPGAIFTIKLPRHGLRTEIPQAVADPAGEAPAWAESVPDLKGIKVLVVDDEPDARDLVATTLRRCGATVLTAASAAQALQVFTRERPHALLSDIGMPEEDGLSLVRKIRSLPPDKGGQTPAAALTAYASAEDRVSVIRAGFQSHIPKPVHAAELAAVVASLVAGGSPTR